MAFTNEESRPFQFEARAISLPKEKEYAQKEGECVLTVAREKVLNINDVIGERVRNKSTEKNPGFSWDSNPRPSEF